MKTILVIEDDELLLSLCAITLQDKGYRVVTATSGESGLALARQHLPDLILSDIQMPGTDGRNVLQALRADPELGARQIVLMTGNPRLTTPRKGMELGADDFLVKPFTPEELAACVEARLRRAQVHWRVEDTMLSGLRATLGTSLPHEFLTPLAGILGLVEVMRDEITVMSAEEIEDVLKDINHSGLQLHRTLKKYLMILDLETLSEGTTPPAPAMLPAQETRIAVLAAVAEVMQRRMRQNDITVTVAETGISARAEDLSIIVDELVDNACYYSRKGTPVKVELGPTGVLTVTDQGRGMTPEQVRQIGSFRQFDQKRYGQQGLGLGLVLAQKLIVRCGGTLAVESQSGAGTTARAKFRVGAP
jgi:DNA-binding response OmpR family regulator/anti-sigma regulatory factor (Ser/Thr protein kinase)